MDSAPTSFSGGSRTASMPEEGDAENVAIRRSASAGSCSPLSGGVPNGVRNHSARSEHGENDCYQK